VAGIFAAKGRPSDHPLIVHVPDAAAASTLRRRVPPVAQPLMQAFWPGPLTLILPRRPERRRRRRRRPGLHRPALPGAPGRPRAAAGLRRRQPAGPGVAGPSANRFGRVSPTTAQHVASEFDDGVLVLDGGATPVGIESAIVDCTRGRPVLLRPAPHARADRGRLRRAVRCRTRWPGRRAARLRHAGGALRAQAKVRLMDAGACRPRSTCWARRRQHRGLCPQHPAHAHVAAHTAACPTTRLETARQLFAVLRDFDAAGVKLIWVETPPTARLGRRARPAGAGPPRVVPQVSNDFWLQAKVGELIARDHAIPKTILFPFTEIRDARFNAHEWLPSLLFYWLIDLVGEDGLPLVMGAAGVALFSPHDLACLPAQRQEFAAGLAVGLSGSGD
jgi:L-threonylcarbamoyladenylate synthase